MPGQSHSSSGPPRRGHGSDVHPWIGLACFLVSFLWIVPGGRSPALVLAGLGGVLTVLSGGHLAARLGNRCALTHLALALSFGGLFPVLAVGASDVYRFEQARLVLFLGVPPSLPWIWCGFLLLAVSLVRSLSDAGALPRVLRCRQAVSLGLVLACLEVFWDTTLLRERLLLSSTPSFGGWPLGFTPGWPLAHFLIGFVFGRVLESWHDLGPRQSGRFIRALGLLVLPPLLFVLGSRFVPGTRDVPLPWVPSAFALWFDAGLAVLAAALLLLFFEGALSIVMASSGPRPRVLFTTVTSPVEPWDGEDILDFHASRFSRGQGPFVNESETPCLALHHLARNLAVPSRVLEYPTMEQIEAELRRRHYPIVGISFTIVSRPKVLEMCRMIRRVSPRSRIVLGGHGVSCLDPDLSPRDELEGLFDDVCRGEGVAFMRQLLGEEPGGPRDHSLPPQYVYPMGMRFLPQPMMPLVAGFGCSHRCDFCHTSAFFGGRHISVASAEDIAHCVRKAYRDHPGLVAVPIFEEDYLSDRERARRVGELLDSAPEVPPGAAPLSIFATLRGLSQFESEELVRMRIGYVWTGVESKFSRYPKRRRIDVESLVKRLGDHGICVTASFILGLDEQTPENLEEDMEWFVGLAPVTAQVGLLGPLPGTALYRRLRREGRLLEERWEDQHLYHEVMAYENLPPGLAHTSVGRTYRMLYERHGPSLLRMWRLWLRAHLHLRGHPEGRIRERAAELRRQLRLAYPATVASLHFAPNEHVRELASDAIETWMREVEPPRVKDRLLGLAASLWVFLRSLRLRYLGKPQRQPIPRFTAYQGTGA